MKKLLRKRNCPKRTWAATAHSTEEILQGLRSQHKKEVDEYQVKLRDLEKQRKLLLRVFVLCKIR